MTQILFAILVLERIYRWVLILAGHEYYTHFAFDTNLDPIVLGCLIAVSVKRRWSPAGWMLHPLSLVSAIILGVVFWRSIEVVMLALALILIYVVSKPPLWLNNPLVRFLGLISYSLYLCHEYVAVVLWLRLVGLGFSVPAGVGNCSTGAAGDRGGDAAALCG